MTEHPTTTPRVVLGVLGGLGPVASAEFVRTVYAHCAGEREQDFPAVVLRSDPSFDARSPAAMDDEDAALPDRFADGVRALLAQGCTHVVVACMTLHHLLPRLPAELRRRVVSVVDVLVAGVAAAGPGPHLLLCSRVARAVGLFERHPRWPEVAPSVVLPSVARNDDLHAAIMDIKVNRGHGAARRWLAAELARYGTASAVAGCSEIHVLAKEWQGPSGPRPLTWIDPFDAIARATAAQDLTTLARQAATAAGAATTGAAGARPAGSAAR